MAMLASPQMMRTLYFLHMMTKSWKKAQRATGSCARLASKCMTAMVMGSAAILKRSSKTPKRPSRVICRCSVMR